MKKSMLISGIMLALFAGTAPARAESAPQMIQMVDQNHPTGEVEDGDSIYFGTANTLFNGFDARWVVLDADQMNTGQKGMFLLSKNLVGSAGSQSGGVFFDDDGRANDGSEHFNDWKISDARMWCRKFAASCIYPQEKEAVVPTKKSDPAWSHTVNSVSTSFEASENILNGDQVFFLSAEEAGSLYGSLLDTSERIGLYGGKAAWWWLRSPVGGVAAAVDRFGNVNYRNVAEESPARPACNLDWSDVLFTCDTRWKKPADSAGSDNLVSPMPSAGKRWKLTLKDSAHLSFAVRDVSRVGDLLSFSYAEAAAGENEYISAVITDSSGELAWYGVLENAESSSGQAQIDLKGKYEKGNTLYIFNEQINGTAMTDYASGLRKVIVKENVSLPKAADGLVYSGGTLTGVKDGAGYTVSGGSAIEAGSYKATARLSDPEFTQWEDGTTDPKTIQWNIDQAGIQNTVLTNVLDKAYTGQPLTQNPVVKLGGQLLTAGKDYTVSYANNTAPGTAVMTITGKGSFTGTRTATFRILQGETPKKETPKNETAQKNAAKKETVQNNTLHKDSDILGGMRADESPKGSSFGLLQLKSTSWKPSAVTLKWKKVSGAKKYTVFGNRCGQMYQMKKIRTLSGSRLTMKKISGRKVKKGVYYKFLVAAYDKKGRMIAVSQTVHTVTKGGKYGNDKKVVTAAPGGMVAIRKGGRFSLSAGAVPKSAKYPVKKHRRIRYESTDTSVASVTAKGVIKGKRAGKCSVFAYAQNGICARVSVVVR